MHISITGRHVELTKGLTDYAKKRFKKLEEYFDFKETGELHVVIEVQKYRHIAEAQLHSKKHDFAAKVETKDMYSSIDKLENKLVAQVHKQKDKFVRDKARGKRINVLAAIPSMDNIKGEKYNEIVEEELQSLKPMNTEEAIEEVEMAKEGLLLFYNADFNKVCMIRKRKDKKYGMTISKY